ncbi:3-hydroxyacyl-CoA dehydrogenase, partial [Ochrobactrum sp. SFR4]|nr:3-hydroxyacyl-CoA dehydrogenase [Ochrobactrum sp. SFR4]
EQTAAKILSKARGRVAPSEALRLVSLSATLPAQQALAEERATFLHLRESDEARALRYVFFAERDAGKQSADSTVATRKVTTIGIAGTGLMGS